MARSYIKLYGPPILKGLRALEKVAVEMSKETTMRFYNVTIPPYVPELEPSDYEERILPETALPPAQKVKLISRASDTLGDYDFFFEWGEEPTKEQVLDLIEKIDKALAESGCKYTIITK